MLDGLQQLSMLGGTFLVDWLTSLEILGGNDITKSSFLQLDSSVAALTCAIVHEP